MRALRRFFLTVSTVALLAAAGASSISAQEEAAAQPAAETPNPRVVIETDKGRIVAELFADKAPKTVENFLAYVESGFFDGTIFHRVIPGFMIQGGGFTPDMKKKPTRAPIENEADNGVSNTRGTLAMARTMDPHSATAQFFINTVDNGRLDHTGKNARGWGYTVFGEVVEGLETVDAISAVKTGLKNRMRDVPVETVTIKSIRPASTASEETPSEEADQ